MPLDLADITTNSATARVDYGEAGDINITFRPENVTEATVTRWRVVAKRAATDATATADDDDETQLERVGAALNTILAQLIISHDLRRRGVPVPPTEEGYATVPLDVRRDMLTAIMEEMSLDPKALAPSPPPSPATPAPAGRATSPKRASKRSRPR